MVMVAERGRERVDGRLRPGKEVNRTLMVEETMMNQLLGVPTEVLMVKHSK